MLIIRDIELKKTYTKRGHPLEFQTKIEATVAGGWSPTKITLTDEQTAKAVEFIIGLVRDSLSVEMEKPEPIIDEATAEMLCPTQPAPVPGSYTVVDAAEMARFL